MRQASQDLISTPCRICIPCELPSSSPGLAGILVVGPRVGISRTRPGKQGTGARVNSAPLRRHVTNLQNDLKRVPRVWPDHGTLVMQQSLDLCPASATEVVQCGVGLSGRWEVRSPLIRRVSTPQVHQTRWPDVEATSITTHHDHSSSHLRRPVQMYNWLTDIRVDHEACALRSMPDALCRSFGVSGTANAREPGYEYSVIIAGMFMFATDHKSPPSARPLAVSH